MAVFAGDASEKEGKPVIQAWSIEPPVPINTRLYRCEQTFQLDILKEMMDVKETFGIVTLDRRECTIGLLKGTQILPLDNITSGVPGKVKAGGQSAARFSRLSEEASKEFFKSNEKIEDLAIVKYNLKEFEAFKKKIKPVLIDVCERFLKE